MIITSGKLLVPMDVQERHNRNVMLQRVKIFWLKGVLEESLHGAELIDLNMALRPNAVAHSHAPGWQQGDEFDTPLSIGTKVWDVFDLYERIDLFLEFNRIHSQKQIQLTNEKLPPNLKKRNSRIISCPKPKIMPSVIIEVERFWNISSRADSMRF